jgi:hypothetical protein
MQRDDQRLGLSKQALQGVQLLGRDHA